MTTAHRSFGNLRSCSPAGARASCRRNRALSARTTAGRWRTRPSWLRPQQVGEIDQHAGRGTPDVVLAPRKDVEVPRPAGILTTVTLAARRVEDELQRHLEDLGDLEGIGDQGLRRPDQ